VSLSAPISRASDGTCVRRAPCAVQHSAVGNGQHSGQCPAVALSLTAAAPITQTAVITTETFLSRQTMTLGWRSAKKNYTKKTQKLTITHNHNTNRMALVRQQLLSKVIWQKATSSSCHPSKVAILWGIYFPI